MKKLRLGLLIPLTALLVGLGSSCDAVHSIWPSGSKDSSTSESVESVTSESVVDSEDSSVEEHTHVWSDATCDAPKACGCGETEGGALGHSYGEVSYVWSEDFTSCTASRTCANDSSHVETETVEAEVVETSPTCSADGAALYTATFENEAFVKQSKSEVLPAFGHDYTELKFDENNHWYACGCGVEDSENKEAHYGGTATATELAICEVCSQPYGDVLNPFITSVAIKNTDSAQYNAETKTFTVKADGSGDVPILEATGENFDLLSNYDSDTMTWDVWFASAVGAGLTNSWWTIEGNTATSEATSFWFSWLTIEPWEIQYSNDNGETWIPTGYYVAKEAVEVTEVPSITSVVIKNTDSAQYNAETKTFTIKADGSGDVPILEAMGENFDLLSNYDSYNTTWAVWLAPGSSIHFTSGWWTIEGNTATLEMPSFLASQFKTEPHEIQYTNDNQETWISTGYYVVLETVEVTEVPSITSVVIKNTDSAQYNAETKTFTVKADGSGDVPILEATGENFDLLSNYGGNTTWCVMYAPACSLYITSGWWMIEGNAATYTYDSVDIGQLTTEPWEIKYSNDDQATWIPTGYYVVLETVEVTEVPEITSVVIKNTDSAQYNAETKTFTVKADGSGDLPILEATGENFDLFSNYGYDAMTWCVSYAPAYSSYIASGWWMIEGNTATYTYDSVDIGQLTTEPWEIQYTNDGQTTWIPTGYYVVLEAVEVTEVPEITSVVIKNTDSAQYNAETKTFTVKADGSGDMPILEATGENFDLLSNYASMDSTWAVKYVISSSNALKSGWWTIEGNTATLEMPSSWASLYSVEPWEIRYTNDGRVTWILTGYYVVLETVEATEVPEITGVVIKNTDSAQYNAETKTFTVKADGSGDMPILEVTGENFDLLSNYVGNTTWSVRYAPAYSSHIANSSWTVDGNTATLEIPSSWVSQFKTEVWEIQYTNDNGETWIPTGYYVVLEN